jgi:hypothetical protein
MMRWVNNTGDTYSPWLNFAKDRNRLCRRRAWGVGPRVMMPTALTLLPVQFYKKGRMPRPVEPLTVAHRPPPWMIQETTNQVGLVFVMQ